MIFDININVKYTPNLRLVPGGHRTEPTSSIKYSSVVSRDIIRLGFLLVLINDLDICAVDIWKSYLNSKFREKLWCEARPEFEGDTGSVTKL